MTFLINCMLMWQCYSNPNLYLPIASKYNNFLSSLAIPNHLMLHSKQFYYSIHIFFVFRILYFQFTIEPNLVGVQHFYQHLFTENGRG